MIEIKAGQRSYNRICGTSAKFHGIHVAISYIFGEMSSDEYKEFYTNANDEGKSAMDAIVLDYLASIEGKKVSA